MGLEPAVSKAKTKSKSSKSTDSHKATAARKKSKKFQTIRKGIVHIQASFSNTIITITDLQGNSLCQASSGSEGFKGSRKSTPFAAQVATETAAKYVKDSYNMEEVIIIIKGIGPGSGPAVKAMKNYFNITEIRDRTGIPHNGPRESKKRRV